MILVPPGEAGMILVNVLMMVAIAAGLVLLLINREELALDRGLRTREAARALAAVRGGEVSAIVALRRDGDTSPGQDYPGEPWGALSESGAPIEGGTFDLAISDAEGRFNINNVRSGEAASLIMFQTIARTIGLSDMDMDACVQMVRLGGPVTDLRPIRAMGLDPAVLDRLEKLVTALPGTTTINLNAADEEMLLLLFRDEFAVHRLIEKRNRRGYLTPADLVSEKLSIPWGTSFRSTSFWVRTRATIGGTTQQGATLMKRRWDQRGQTEVFPIERWRGAAVPPDAPQFVVKS
ncbi:type II secretion system protein GspK [Sphingomonas sp. LB-2]|uniref:general secretion pathway protein GspK n=1 Tax=Sphingomonas caeni TaxID=2984949 RepID=UPI00222E4D85|nr:type II secretion system protein GspK [Sphingomonas caeni]MCW3847458.1 type II secretion system protein GspK [Sphingomonas caeni]